MKRPPRLGGLPIDQDDALVESLRTLFEKMDRSSANVKIKDIQ